MKTKPDTANYRLAYVRLVAEYNALKAVDLRWDETPPDEAAAVREAVREMADVLMYTDDEMRALGITWHD